MLSHTSGFQNWRSDKTPLAIHLKLPDQELPSSWALGWQVFHNSTGDFIFHAGHNAGFHGAAVASPTSKRGYVAMINGENGATVLRNMLTSERMQQFLVGSDGGQT